MPTPAPDPRAASDRRWTSRFNRIFEAKLTPTVALLFFVALAVMCGLAAGIGYVSQNLRHAEVRR